MREALRAAPFQAPIAHRVRSYRNKKCRAKARHFHWRDGETYFAAISALVMSSMRLEKPHSLSYQLNTFTNVPPMTRVWVAS